MPMIEETAGPMELMHAESYEEAWREVQRLKTQADTDTVTLVYKIVPSPYAGFDIVAIDPSLYGDMVSTQLVDGLPTLLPSRKVASGGSMP